VRDVVRRVWAASDALAPARAGAATNPVGFGEAEPRVSTEGRRGAFPEGEGT
jgi:hypothetical protein